MAVTESGSAAALGAATPNWLPKYWGLIAAVVVLLVIVALPTPAGLPLAGQRMLAIFGFAVVVWITEALDYAVSAVVIAALMAVLLGISPNVANPKALYGTVAGLTMAASGFSNVALILVAAALFLAAAMTITGLDHRIALVVLRRVGARTSRVVIGTIIVAIVLAFLVPSATARAAAVIPIMMGVILAFGVDRKSRFAGMMMITTVQAVSIWNVGIKTAAAQNMIAIGFFESILHQDVTWLNWLIAAAPFSILMSVGLYYIVMVMMPPEAKELPGGEGAVAKALAQLGPMTGAEKRLLTVSLTLLCFWATEGKLHSFDSQTTTTVAVALLFLPGIGVMDWRRANTLIPWGTVVLFGVGIGLGTALLQTQAAQWLAGLIVQWFGLNQLAGIGILAVMALFLVIIHLGFASATALASTMIPIIIAIMQKVQTPGINVLGMTLLLQFAVSFGFILPVNSPQGMLAYGTQTFVVRDFVRTGLAITVLAYMLTLVFGATYWRWLGYV
ncbi:MAG TPA: DASS family sodium-coupled anion symporter [Xanthobacteraceae bacterium]|nr:DASS family sodium-coupled anion symporter [Xanthobacteraceae bacterium]